MLYRKMPGNGDELSILGFGCMRLPVKDGAIDEERAKAQVRHAIDQGVNYIDTAWTYHAGESENFVGRVLQDGYREKVRLATKLPTYLVNSPEDPDRFLNTQLEKLRTDHIDYYLLHTLTGGLWDRMEALGIRDFLDAAKADGRIINAGFSFHGMPEDFNRIVDACDWDFCQIQYNYLDEENQAGTKGLKYAASKGLGVMIMEPLRGGNLGLPDAPPDVAAIWNEAEVKRPPVEWALRWVWNHPEVIVVLSGMNEEAHVEQNLKIACEAEPKSLTDEELALVKRAGDKYRELMKVGCTGCGYCMPCPAGVDIPGSFEVYNKMHLFGNIPEGRMSYVIKMSGILRKGVANYASQCVECGQCLPKCPQNLRIPDLLKPVVTEMEGPDLEERMAKAVKIMNLKQQGQVRSS